MMRVAWVTRLRTATRRMMRTRRWQSRAMRGRAASSGLQLGIQATLGQRGRVQRRCQRQRGAIATNRPRVQRKQ